MKTSVSIPDDLWQVARDLDDGQSPSGLIQQALHSWVQQQQSLRGYRRTPELSADLQAKQEQAAQRFQEMLRDRYTRGYAQGVELAEHLSPEQLDYVVSDGVLAAAREAWDFEVDQTLPAKDRRFPEGTRPFIEGRVLAPFLRAHVSPALDDQGTPPAATVEGIDQALRDIREMAGTL